MKKQPLGILSGTFDPIHLGHTHLASKIHQQCNIQNILLTPCYQSPFKKEPLANIEDRLNMINLAIKELPYLSVLDYEIRRPTISYTINILRYLSQINENTSLMLIMGIDVFNNFDEWREWKEILELTHILVVGRKNHEAITNEKVKEILRERKASSLEQLQNKNSGLIYTTNIDPLPITATEIRELIKQNKDANHMLDKNVWRYINDKKLYR